MTVPTPPQVARAVLDSIVVDRDAQWWRARAITLAVDCLERQAVPSVTFHVDTQPDMETTARLFNDGFDAAMTQHLADDPTAADDWLAERDAQLLRPLQERLEQISYLMSFEYSASVLGEREAARSIGLVRYLRCPPRVRRLLHHVMARSERIRSVLEGS